MFVEIGLECKGLVTPLACVVFEGGMSLHVCSEVGTVCERLATVSAAVRLLPCVRTQMSLQQPGPRERLVAHRTLVTQTVRQDVHGQGRHADVHLVTMGTRLGLLAVQTSVGLLVSGKVGRRCILLAALATRISLSARTRLNFSICTLILLLL